MCVPLQEACVSQHKIEIIVPVLRFLPIGVKGPYSQAVRAGNLLLTSGQLGLDPETGALPESLEAQTEQSLKNIDAILTAAGYARADVVKTTVFIRSMKDFGTVNRIYEAYFGEHKPARSCVEVSALPKDGLVEIEAVASR